VVAKRSILRGSGTVKRAAFGIPAFRNTPEITNTIRVDSKVVHETDSARAKSDESAWMRLTLDTVGKVKCPEDRQGRSLYPEGFESHVNTVVADTRVWEQTTACVIATHERAEAFVKNTGMGFAVPCLHNGQPHDYVPDFIILLAGNPPVHLILETKGYDVLAEIKTQAAERWAKTVNADGRFGQWRYAIARKPPRTSISGPARMCGRS
jgi:hypothetical protein